MNDDNPGGRPARSGRPRAVSSRRSRSWALAATVWASLLLACGPSLAPAPARAAELAFHNPFAPCEHDCTASLFAGQLVKTSMWEIFVTKHIGPWDWDWQSSTFVGGAFSREIVTWGRGIAVEVELGAGKRFGFLDEGEFWGAFYFRWKRFPWSDYLRTSVAVSLGLNYATEIPVFERERAKGAGNHLLHYLSPEITFGLPSQPDLDVFFRFHHRSGGELAIFNHTGGGAQYGTAGVRYRF